ncbi:MAG: hypothetical protein ACRDTC_17895 [Pseudonocardiaceae bacterium]
MHGASGSKPETETTVGDADALRAVFTALGFEVVISFQKRCRNYRFTAAGRPLLATLAFVPELGEKFLEIESIVDTDSAIDPALEAIREVLGALGIDRNDETTEAYTEAVATRGRSRRQEQKCLVVDLNGHNRPLPTATERAGRWSGRRSWGCRAGRPPSRRTGCLW